MTSRQLPVLKPGGPLRKDEQTTDGKYFVGKIVIVWDTKTWTPWPAIIDLMWTPKWARIKVDRVWTPGQSFFPGNGWIMTDLLDLMEVC